MNKQEKNIIKSHWLNTRGGRNWSDLKKDENGEYILMGDGRGGEQKVYIPTIEHIISSLKLKLK